ncbi:YoaH family protein [Sodalis sp. RH19]|uniref:YoaH family protein n=1 Tax=Sodalis sp. RH19 TaxID=3394334 RepID=UPI0039B65A13
MLTDMPALNHEQQQQAVERIQALMADGMSSGEAIRLVSNEIRATHTGERVSIRWDDDENDDRSYAERNADERDARNAALEQDDDDEDGAL